jgi:hypothetical protein
VMMTTPLDLEDFCGWLQPDRGHHQRSRRHTWCLSTAVSNCGCGLTNPKPIGCGSDVGISWGRPGADCAGSQTPSLCKASHGC